MTPKKMPELNIGTIVEKVVRGLNFTSHGSSETLPTEKYFKVELERMMQRQLPGGTYIYILEKDEVRGKYLISKYSRGSEDYSL